jgi:hypothetical protein
MAKTPKRPRDLNQWAKHIVDVATDAKDATPTPKPKPKQRKAPEPKRLKK